MSLARCPEGPGLLGLELWILAFALGGSHPFYNYLSLWGSLRVVLNIPTEHNLLIPVQPAWDFN